MFFVYLGIAIVVGYLMGSIPASLIISKKDIVTIPSAINIIDINETLLAFLIKNLLSHWL